MTALQSPASGSDVASPNSLVQDDPSAVESARLRLSPKTSWFPLSKRLSRIRTRSDVSSTTSVVSTTRVARRVTEDEPVGPPVPIELDSHPPPSEHADMYRWAYLDENQRGLFIFSIPYFSGSVLLPIDPLPFTIPTTSPTPTFRSHQPDVSLEHFPLPSGEWQWVSKAWMIDMRNNDTVQHDGFEYNSRFQSRKWTPRPGHMSLVRRRRWMRLARRTPADILEADPRDGVSSNNNSILSYPIINGGSEIDSELIEFGDPEHIWRGDDIEHDWKRCQAAMKRLDRDGRKIELWRSWLCVAPAEPSAPRKQWTEDDFPTPQEPEEVETKSQLSILPTIRKNISDVLRVYGREIVDFFVYPESRVQLYDMLGRSGLLAELNVPLGMGSSASAVDFWSYASALEKECEDDAEKAQRLKDAEEDEEFRVARKATRDKVISES